MLLGNLSIGSKFIMDLQRNGWSNYIGEIKNKVDDNSVEVLLDYLMPFPNRYAIVEVTDKESGHVYRYTKVTLTMSPDSAIIRSDEDIDFRQVRQEKRFKFRMPCQLKIGDKYITGACTDDVSLSGLSIILPRDCYASVGDILNITTYYTDRKQYNLTASVVRCVADGISGMLLGCKIMEGTEFTKAVIQKLQKV